MPRPIAELFGDVASIVRECLGGVARFPPAAILQRLRQAPVPYVFGEVRVATLALLTFTAFGTSLLWRRYHTHESTGGTGPDPPARIPKIRPGQLSISGLVDISTSCRGGWIKDNGGLSPIALCGLTSLYSVRHSSTFSPASSRSRNQWRPRHSSRTVALKWPDSRKSVRSFKGIICDNISEFESYMPSHAVRSPWASGPATNTGPLHTLPRDIFHAMKPFSRKRARFS
jgi:hypothetical protein